LAACSSNLEGPWLLIVNFGEDNLPRLFCQPAFSTW
jgi:hypothetical protein